MDVRPIDANALLRVPNVNKVTEYDETGCGMDYMAVPVKAIEDASVLDYAPVRHAKWSHYFRSAGKVTVTGEMVCSCCKHSIFRITGTRFNFCPNCGAKMDGVS